ncbi:hypothetical protein LWI28_022695 [Acer negundo]|uniref:Uncharacterized protein n=1 Tax=Acer negundo TaxID=4023 RepID=A0AAD5J0Q8_ACENE|nr:hypothetical protein LWI28_022695 [Acer negundo]
MGGLGNSQDELKVGKWKRWAKDGVINDQGLVAGSKDNHKGKERVRAIRQSIIISMTHMIELSKATIWKKVEKKVEDKEED